MSNCFRPLLALLVATGLGFVLVVGLSALATAPTHAASSGEACNVPGEFSTIQAAVDVITCSTVIIAPGTYAENVSLDRSVEIRGAGAGMTIVDGGGIGIVVEATTSLDESVILRDLALTNGGAGGLANDAGTIRLLNVEVSGNDGGGISNGRGVLVVESSLIFANTAGSPGGGISNSGVLTITESTILNNTSDVGGGGIYQFPGTGETRLFMADSVVTGNRVLGAGDLFVSGGGLRADSGNVTILRSLFSDNHAGGTGEGRGGGGGINYDADGVLTLENVTLSGNHAVTWGGAIRTGFNNPTLFLTNITLANNSVEEFGAGGIENNSGTITMKNTIIAGNDAPNCNSGGTLISSGHNLEDGDSCNLTSQGDLPDTKPLLGPLAVNDGPTETHALLGGSPAIDGGDNTGCPPTDQRGVARPIDGNGDGIATCDIGAYEHSPAPTSVTLSTLAVQPGRQRAMRVGILGAALALLGFLGRRAHRKTR